MNRALLVGIDLYKNVPSLRGCVTDANEMAAFLRRRAGFRASEIRVLKDRRATTKAIVGGIGWLVRDLADYDRAIFFYSGHGAQLLDPLPPRKATRVFDAICPHDFDWTPGDRGTRRAITRSTVERLLKRVPRKTEVLFVSDSCHSGDFLMGRRERPDSPERPDLLKKRLKPPAENELYRTVRPHSIRERVGMRVPKSVALFAACQSDQTARSAMIHGAYHGVFTFYLLSALKEARALETPLQVLSKQVRLAIRKAGYGQIPDLDASKAAGKRSFPHLKLGGTLPGRRPRGARQTRPSRR